MKILLTSLSVAFLALAAGGATAQETMKKGSTPAKDSMMAKPMTMQECKDHMAMSAKAAKKDDAMMKKDAACSEMMKKEGAAKK